MDLPNLGLLTVQTLMWQAMPSNSSGFSQVSLNERKFYILSTLKIKNGAKSSLY